MDINLEIRRAVTTGKVVLGTERTLKSLRAKKAELIVVASNCPADVLVDLERYAKSSGTTLYRYPSSNAELGTASGKPFSVNAMAVLDPGSSNLLAAVGR